MKRAFSVFTLLLCLGMLLGLPNPLQAAKKKKKLSLVENDENVNDPDYCFEQVAFCLQYGSTDTLELTVSTLNQQRPRIAVAIINPNNGAVIWEAIPSNISLVGPNAMSASSFTFEVVLDLSMTFASDDRYKLRVVGYDTGIGSITTGGGGSSNNTKNGFPDYVFQGTVICVKNQCNIRSSCPCEGKGTGNFGLLGGQQIPQFDPLGVIRGKIAPNFNNKFVGIQYNTFAKGLYYQAELQLSQLTFLADDTIRNPTGGSPVIEQQTHALNHIYLVPLQLRLRLGRFASVGVGGAISYVLNYQVDELETIFPGSGGDKIEPEIFGDIRLGNAQGGFQVGYRFSRHWSGLDDLTGDNYRLGKVYLSYAF
ncbi:MAG: hypothetical protein AB8H47_25940 [Bacteroidia bacterium]